jgi:poly-gamma-glutamate capsule biosynthesis protein CapA/YwtB (metallophosphatase superfamily)
MLAAVPFTGIEPPENMLADNLPPEHLTRPKETRIVFGGDVMLSRFVGRLARARRDPSSPLKDLAPVLAAADISFVNLEAPFSDRGGVVEGGMVFKAEPEMVEALQLAKVDVVSTANNHARDCGSHGVAFTVDWLEQHGIAVAGTGRTAEAAHAGTVLTRNGQRFGFLAYTYDQSNGNHTDWDARIATMDVSTMRRDVRNMLTRADVVTVSMHAGWEYWTRANPQQVEFARAAIDAGARVVVGHHPHVVQPWEHYRSGVIFYSLGNLVFDQFQRPETQHGELAEVVFSGSSVARAELIPVEIIATVPRLASASGALRRGA